MIVVLNNKSNLNKEEFLRYQEELKTVKHNSKLVLCPTFININLFNLENIELGAQDVSSEDDGAYTGEISAKDLHESNVKYIIIGHSERRKYQKESLFDINKKIKKVLENNIIPILCIGETKEDRDNGNTKDVLREELLTAIENISFADQQKIIIAYEPVWSIGTGKIPTIEQIDDVIRFIRNYFPNNTVLYGGSVDENNIDTLKDSKEINGYLLGGLSLKPQNLQKFIEKLELQ